MSQYAVLVKKLNITSLLTGMNKHYLFPGVLKAMLNNQPSV